MSKFKFELSIIFLAEDSCSFDSVQVNSQLNGEDVNPYLLLVPPIQNTSVAVPGDVVFSSLSDWFGISGSKITFTSLTPSRNTSARLSSSPSFFSNVSALSEISYPLPDPFSLLPGTLPFLSPPKSLPGNSSLYPANTPINSGSTSDGQQKVGLIIGLVVGLSLFIAVTALAVLYFKPCLFSKSKCGKVGYEAGVYVFKCIMLFIETK